MNPSKQSKAEFLTDQLTASYLDKFEISELNSMQKETFEKIQKGSDIVLLSPTGTGKTLAFLLPLMKTLDANLSEIQLLILVPSRELAQQIEQVVRKMGSGFKVNSVYGGRSGVLDKLDLRQRPAILIGTPGRIADRIRRDQFPLEHIRTLILDEYDKSLEIGFEAEMAEILGVLPQVRQRILTSATSDAGIPGFVGLENPVFINYLPKGDSQLSVKVLLTNEKDKLSSLKKSLAFIGPKPGIIFCSFKDALERISIYLNEQGIHHECFHGDMEQFDREKALIKLRNGTSQILLATDLAARGLDIPEVEFIMHYHLPLRSKEFTHRNGRTARMNRTGIAYILHWREEDLPDFIAEIRPELLDVETLSTADWQEDEPWLTLYISGGRRDKISKGDIVGLFTKQGQIDSSHIGLIEIRQDSAYVAIRSSIAHELLERTNNSRLKSKKVRISLA